MQALPDHLVKLALTPLNYHCRHQLLKLHQALQKRAFYSAFSGKVDYIGSIMPNYTDIVKNPIGLSTIQERVALVEYEFLVNYLNDVFLMHSNCLNFQKQSGTTSLEAQLQEMLSLICQWLNTIFKQQLSFQEYQAIGVSVNLQIVTPFEYDVDVSQLYQLLGNLNVSDQASIYAEFGKDFSELPFEEMFKLERTINRKIFHSE